MGKIKKTQIYKNARNNISFLTSKNKYIINKENKRTRNYLNTRTLDSLKQYGYGYIGKNQDGGGFIINYLKLKYKLRQFKKFIKKFRKEEINIKKYIDSYQGKATTFKQLSDDKAGAVTLYIISYRKKAIYEFMFQNIDSEKQFKTSNLQHEMELIDSRIVGANQSIKSFEKSVKKEIPKFKKYNKALQKDSKNFRKLVKFFESKLRKYYVTITQIKKDYNLYHDKKHIDDADKKKIKKYKRFGADIETILKFKDTDVQNMNAIQANLDTILDTGKDYVEKFEQMAKENYNEDLDKWKDNYSSIYENFTPINENINKLIENIKELKNNFEGMLIQAQSIYVAGSSKDKNLYLSTKDVITNCDRFIQLLNLFNGSVNKLKIVILNETPFDKIEIDLLYIEGGLKDIEKQLNLYKVGINDDKENIETLLSTAKKVGGGKKKMKGGATHLNNLKYKEFFQLDYSNFKKLLLDEIKYFKNGNDSYIKDGRYVYEKILSLFNIFLFSIYITRIRGTDCHDTSKDLNNGVAFTIESSIIDNFLRIIAIYEIAKKTPLVLTTEFNFNNDIITLIKKYRDDIILKLEPYINNMFTQMDAILNPLPLKLQDLVCDYSSGTLVQNYSNANKADPNTDNFTKLIIQFIDDSPNDKISKITDILKDVDKIKDYTFVKYYELNDKTIFFDNIYEDIYNNIFTTSLASDKIEDLDITIPEQKYIKELLILLNISTNPIPTTVQALLTTIPVPIVTPPIITPPIITPPIITPPVTPPVTTTTATTTAPVTPSLLKPKFLFDIEKLKDIDSARINLNNIKNHITNILTIINQQLTSSVFSSITNNINKINENVNNLKLIEPKLINVKIDEYDKVVLKYDWLKDNYKMSDEPKIEITETKEIAKLLHEINPASKITGPSGEITKDEIMQLINKFIFPNPTSFSKDSFNKLKDKKNAELFLNLLDKEYPDSREKSKACTILFNIKQQDPVDGIIYERLRSIECQKVSEEKAKKDAEKAAAAIKAAAAAAKIP